MRKLKQYVLKYEVGDDFEKDVITIGVLAVDELEADVTAYQFLKSQKAYKKKAIKKLDKSWKADEHECLTVYFASMNY